jgi:putative transposase
MRDWQSQSHVRWYCKYHIVFVPKYRRRVIYGQLRRSIGRIIRELCQQQGVELGVRWSKGGRPGADITTR